MTRSEFKKLIDRYLAGQSTRQETEEVERFYAHIVENHKYTHNWNSDDKIRIRNRIYSKIRQNIRERKASGIRIALSGAAAALALLISGYFYYYSSDDILPPGPDTFSEQITVAGMEEQSIFLSDGSYVLLSPGAILTYPNQFESNSRVVRLSGEAWFDVSRDTLAAFSVITNDITTTVLGTSFSINAHPEKSKVEVRVTSGKVQVAAHDKELAVLEEDDQLQYDSGEYTVTKDVQEDNGMEVLPEPGNWKFTNVTMKEAVRFLEKHWNKTFVFENPSIGNCPLYASFNSDDGLDEVLMILCGITNSEYQIENDKIIIYGTGCNLIKN